MSATVVKIPKCQNDITTEWLKEVIKSKDSKFVTASSDNIVEIIEIFIVEVKNAFLSGASKAKVNINGKINNLFIKTIVNPDDPLRFLYDDNRFDEVEISFYQEYLPDLVSFVKEEIPDQEENNSILGMGLSINDIIHLGGGGSAKR